MKAAIRLNEIAALFSVTIISGCLAPTSDNISLDLEKEKYTIPPPANLSSLATINLYATYYQKKHGNPDPGGVPLRDKNDNPISDPITKASFCLGAIEGSIQTPVNGVDKVFAVIDGLRPEKDPNNVDCLKAIKGYKKEDEASIAKGGRTRYRISNEEYGNGVRDYRLVPYRVIAIDNNYDKRLIYGSVIYIPNAAVQSVRSRTGEYIRHDGYFIAADRGGSIKGNHIDIFCGDEPLCLPKTTNETPFKAYIVTDPLVISQLHSLITAK